MFRKAAEPERCRAFQKIFNSLPKRGRRPDQGVSTSHRPFFSPRKRQNVSRDRSMKDARPPANATERRRRSRPARPKVIFSPTGGAERDGRLSAGGRNRHSSREHGKAPVKTPPAGTCPHLPPPCRRAPLRPPKPLRLCALGLRSFSPAVTPSPHASRPIAIAAPSCLAPPLSPKRVQHPALPRRRLRLPTTLPLASPPAGGAKKAPFPKRKEGPGSRPKLADARLTLRDRSLQGSRRWCTRSARRRVLPARR